MYRLWLYSLAFHNAAHTRSMRLQPPVIRSRALLLRPWPAAELAEMLDVHMMLRGLLRYHICPSNGTVLRRHKARYPYEQAPLMREGNAKYASPVMLDFQSKYFHSTPQVERLLVSSRGSGGGVVEGWGDEISHYYVVEDMLKLDPGQVLWLYELVAGSGEVEYGRGSAKEAVQAFVNGVGGEWFENNGETFEETVAFVIGARDQL